METTAREKRFAPRCCQARAWHFLFAVALGVFFYSTAFAQVQESQIPSLINIIVSAESAGDPKATGDHGQSRGLLQIKKSVWQKYTRLSFERAFDASANRMVGEAHVRTIIKRLGGRASFALVCYHWNCGFNSKLSFEKWKRIQKNKIYRRTYEIA